MALELGQGARKPENQTTVFRGPGMPQRCTDNVSVPIPIDRLRIHGILASDEGPEVRLPILGSFLSSASLCEKDNKPVPLFLSPKSLCLSLPTQHQLYLKCFPLQSLNFYPILLTYHWRPFIYTGPSWRKRPALFHRRVDVMLRITLHSRSMDGNGVLVCRSLYRFDLPLTNIEQPSTRLGLR